MLFRFPILILLTFCIACDTNKSSELPPAVYQYIAIDYLISQDPDRSSVYFSSVRDVGVEVAYETGAEPYTGVFAYPGSYSVWSVTYKNLADIFADRSYNVGVTVPTDLSDMTEFPDQLKTSWTIPQLLALESSYRRKSSSFSTANFFIAFVQGHLDGSPGVIGVTISGTLGLRAPAIFLFKEVIQNYNDSLSPDKVKKAEQMTVTHELSHALGLVNSGIPMYTAHQDTAHGNHCTNSLCGMYWGLSDTSVNLMNPSNPLILGQECRDDVRHYKP